MSKGSLKCPATMCPLLGLEESGSRYTGGRNTNCESECGWYHKGGCIVPCDLTHMLITESEYDEIPDTEWPSCVYSDECKWQEQASEGVPCPPRLAVILNMDPGRCLF